MLRTLVLALVVSGASGCSEDDDTGAGAQSASPSAPGTAPALGASSGLDAEQVPVPSGGGPVGVAGGGPGNGPPTGTSVAPGGSGGANPAATNPELGTGGTAPRPTAGPAGISGSGGASPGPTGGPALEAGGAAGSGVTDDPVGGSGGASGGGGQNTSGGGGANTAGGPPIVDLFNGNDLAGWTAYRETTSTMAPGAQLSPSDAEQIFKPEDGAIRVYGDQPDLSTQSRHTLVSDESYSKYILWLEYRWGTKVFAPYTDLNRYPRDAGLLFHMHGDLTQVWPASIEFQIKDGTVGDIFALYARCTSLGRDGGSTYDPDGTERVVDGANGFVQHSRSVNHEMDGWNSIEMRVDGGAAVYLVNGEIVNEVLAVNDRSGSTGTPVTSGPIALQAEHAEVFYRNIRIQVLP